MRTSLRNGIRTALRARGRAVLFTLLLVVLTAGLSLGLGMWAYCHGTLAAMDRAYTSVALVEYPGSGYPDRNAADDQARTLAEATDSGAIAALPGVERWEPTDRTLAGLAGYQRRTGQIPYEKSGVVVAENFSPMYRDMYGLVPEEELAENCVIEVMYIDDMGYAYPQTEIFRASGLPDLVVPCYFHYDGKLMEWDETGERSAVDPSQLVEPYYIMGEGLTLVGTLPEGYALGNSAYYNYYPQGDQYWGLRKGVLYGYSAFISDVVYTREGKKDIFAIIEVGDSGFAPQTGEKYLLNILEVEGDTGNRLFALADLPSGDAPYHLLTGAADPALTEGVFVQAADFYRLANDYVWLEASDDIAALEDFQQGRLYLESGRFPEPGEAGTCVVSGATAAQMDLVPGDQVDLTVLHSAQEDIFDLTAGEGKTLTVVGVTNRLPEYEGMVWTSAAEGSFGGPLFGYQLGRAVLDNAQARQTVEAMEAILPLGTRVTLYDQGYYAAARPLEVMESAALAVTAATACGALAVLLLFAVLFVGRQRETVAVLWALGTPGGKLRLWLLSGGAVISGAAAALGAVLGGLGLGRILELALSAARGLYAADLRYSEAAVGAVRQQAVEAALPWWPAPVAGCAVFLVAMVLCAAFIGQARRTAAPKRGKTRTSAPRQTGGALWLRGPARLALLTARRGGWRSAMVPAVALVLSLLVGLLAVGATGWSDQLQQYTEQTEIQGNAVDTGGRGYNNLNITAASARKLWNTGLLSELSVSTGWNYWLAGDMPNFGNNSFGEENRKAWIAQQPELLAVNSLAAAPDFFGESDPPLTWAEGMAPASADEFFSGEYLGIYRGLYYGADMRGEKLPVYPVVVSQQLLAERGLALGDRLQVEILIKDRYGTTQMPLELLAAGAYVQQGGDANIYIPLSAAFDPQWLTGEEDVVSGVGRGPMRITSQEDLQNETIAKIRFQTLHFTLASGGGLGALRDALEEAEFSQVGALGRERTTLVLRDQVFTETVGALGRYLTFSRILFPVLLAAVALLGFVISWLMVSARRMEFAVLRGLGTGRVRVFLSFFLEQGGLCLLGCVPAAAVLALLGRGGPLAAGLFLVCYLLGCALSILVVGRTGLMALLSERE